ncbi:MAG: SRPBCC family protein [Promethearchaeota archaeon]
MIPKIETNLEIEAPREKIFAILDDTDQLPRWNLAVNEIKEVKAGTHFAKTTVGDTTSTRLETIAPERISTKQEGSMMTSLGYILKPLGTKTDARIWAEYDNPDHEKILLSAGKVFLKSLKKYAEYLEQGGNPEDFKKK